MLAGGGARAFAHLGVLETLLGAGLVADRVAGVSMGAFIGGLFAYGYDTEAIDACCYEEWVRRNPINDYTMPRTALIRGRKAEAMLERTFGDVRIEELARPLLLGEREPARRNARDRSPRTAVRGGRDEPRAPADRAAACAARTSC